MVDLAGKKVVVGISGGIAVYKTCEIVSSLRKLGAEVFVIMTENATKFVTPQTFETLSANPVVVDMFSRDRAWEVEHISLAKAADIFVVVPATANIIAKFALGLADDMLSTTMLAAKCKKLICPAMNTAMYENPATAKNIEVLRQWGYEIIDAEDGMLACGDVGIGRLAEPKSIVERIVEMLFPVQDFVGKTVLITLGATREDIDGVRFISNRSSGKMGLALAKAVTERGGKTILVASNTSVSLLGFERVVRVETTKQMYDAVMSNLKEADIIIKVAAPADYALTKKVKGKIKAEKVILELVKNPDIAKAVGEIKGNKKLVVFSAETENLKENALAKIKAKGADLIVANDVTREGAGFETDTNIVSIFTKEGNEFSYPVMSKAAVAHIILDKVVIL